MNQILEDLLRLCILDFGGTWEEHLPLVEFAYNNSYETSIGMGPFEALHGRPCRSPTCCRGSTNNILLGPEMIRETSEKIDLIRRRMKTAQGRQSHMLIREGPILSSVLETWSLLKYHR